MINKRYSKLGNVSKSLFVLCAAILLASSCTEKIDLKLKDSGQHIVIEGKITDQPGPYTIHVYKSLSYYQMDSFPAVKGATVVVSDDAGNSDTLVETNGGFYKTQTLQGTPGRTYTLQTIADGVVYGSTSTMPAPVEIDSLTQQTLVIFGQTRTVVYCKFSDPASMANFYRITSYQDSVQNVVDRVYSDEFSDGNQQTTIVSTKKQVEKGDSILVLLQAIDKPVYTYFSSLRSNTSSQSAAPANPISNISNGALGYFSACTMRSRLIVIPE